MKITKTFIDTAEYKDGGPGTQIHWDDRIPGFGLRLFPSGKKSFIFKYRYGGRGRMASLGQYGAITLHQALALAQQRYLEVKRGLDPQEEIQRSKLAGSTVADLARYFYEHHAKIKNRDHLKAWGRINKWIIPTIGTIGVKDIKRQHIARLHSEIGKNQPTTANRVLAILSKMFNEATNWGFLEEGAPNPARGITKFDEISRDRFISKEEFPRLAKAINNQDQFTKTIIWLYLLTGFRKNELLSLKWTDVTEERLTARFTKAGNNHAIPLAAAGHLLIQKLPRFHDNPYVFPGIKEGAHRKDFRRAWDKILEEAGIDALWVHDLRRTVGSWMGERGVNMNLIKTLLNHSSIAVTQRYVRFSDEGVGKAVEDHGKFLEPFIDMD